MRRCWDANSARRKGIDEWYIMTIEQFVQQFGGAGLLIWVATLAIPVLISHWQMDKRAEAKARDVITEERKVINGLLNKRDEDARLQQRKTETLEGEINLLKDALDTERDTSTQQIGELRRELEDATRRRDELAQRLTDTETDYRQQLEAATLQIDELRREIGLLRTQMIGSEGEKQTLTTKLYEEIKANTRLIAELEFFRGERAFGESVLAKIDKALGVTEPEVKYEGNGI